MKYAGMGTQMIVALGLAVFAGYKLDGWLHLSFPLLIWLLPPVVLCLIIYKIVRDTSKKTNDHEGKV